MQMLAGPGIVINDCNHVAVISDGFRNRVAPPGLSFTGKYEELYAVVDLRPQLRIDPGIKAETKDGITVKILTFMPHRIGADGKQPELTRSFPYNSKDVENAAFYQTRIEHRWNREQEGEKLAHEEVEQVTWDRLVLSVGPPILKDIILRYTYDELLAPGNPRADIADAFSERTRAAMRPMGIEMVGGGISNIEAPDDVVKKRIEKWQAEWQYKILVQSGYAQSEAYRAKALAWTQAQLRTMYALVRVQQAMEDKGVIEPVLERLLIDAVASLMPEAMRPDKPRDLDELTDMPYDPVDTRPRPYLAAREFNPRMRPKT
ncbi:MAG: SPFH domain-containing protein [Chloroflexi bacterium]|nr:SPFH domain-containing protein [Chloroflexota bacterium]